MHLVQHLYKARIPLQKNSWSCSSSKQFADNIVVVGKIASFHEFLQFRKQEWKFSSDTNPTFIGAVYEFLYLLIYLHYRSIKGEEIHERTQMAHQTAGWKCKSNNFSTME